MSHRCAVFVQRSIDWCCGCHAGRALNFPPTPLRANKHVDVVKACSHQSDSTARNWQFKVPDTLKWRSHCGDISPSTAMAIYRHKAASTPATMSKQHCRLLQVERFLSTKSKQIKHFQFVSTFERTKFRSTLLPKPAKFFAKNGNDVEATIDFVERTKFYDKLVRHCCRFWQQSRMLLRQHWTLLWHCCWCGWGLISSQWERY